MTSVQRAEGARAGAPGCRNTGAIAPINPTSVQTRASVPIAAESLHPGSQPHHRHELHETQPPSSSLTSASIVTRRIVGFCARRRGTDHRWGFAHRSPGAPAPTRWGALVTP
jgi:hypothetical protein